MATVNVINGTAVNIGFAGTPGGLSITSPAISTKLILQSAEETDDAERILVHDEVGNKVVSAWVDPTKKVALELIIKGTGLADVIVSTQLVEAIKTGDMLVIGACQQQPGLVGSHWEVQSGAKVSGSNKDAKKYSVSLESSPGITGPAPA